MYCSDACSTMYIQEIDGLCECLLQQCGTDSDITPGSQTHYGIGASTQLCIRLKLQLT
jgi:hypothetical protein